MTETCPICRAVLHRHYMGEKGGYELTGCTACGSVFTEPGVTQEEIDALLEAAGAKAVHLRAHDIEIGVIKKQIRKVLPLARGKRFLDACCRHGYGVVAARELELEAEGIDARGFFVDFARLHYGPEAFHHTTAAAHAAAGKQADIILAREAFCSEPDLDGFTAALSAMLAPGGRIFIEEPDGNSFWLPRHFPNWSVVDPPLSFHFLSAKGLGALLARHGLRIEKKFFAFGPVMWLSVCR
jgi:SAM-dependent methyltransferase